MTTYGTTRSWTQKYARTNAATNYHPTRVTQTSAFPPVSIPADAYDIPENWAGTQPRKLPPSTKKPYRKKNQRTSKIRKKTLPPPPPKPPPLTKQKVVEEGALSQLVTAATKTAHPHNVGRNVQRLHRKQPPRLLYTHQLTIDTAQPLTTIQTQVFTWVFTIIKTMAVYFQNPKATTTDVSPLFSVKDIPDDDEAQHFPHDVVAPAPGISNTIQHGYHAQIQTTAVNGLDGHHCTLIPMPAVEQEPALKLGNNPHSKFLLWVRQQQLQKIRLPPSNTTLPLCLLSVLEVQHFFAIQTFINEQPSHVATSLNTYVFAAFTLFAPYHRVANLMNSLRHSSLTKYLNHLNRIAEYFVYHGIVFHRPTPYQSKTAILQAIQNRAITVDHLQQTFHYLRVVRKLSPGYMLNIHAAFAYFYRHFTNEPLHLQINYNLTIATLRRMDWDQDNSSFLLTAPQIDALITLCKEAPNKYGNLGHIIEFGAAMILRTGELINDIKFKDVDYQTHWINKQNQEFICLTLRRAKNAKIPKTKMIPLTNEWSVINPNAAYLYLLAKANDTNGLLAIDADGDPLGDTRFRALLTLAMKALVLLFPELRGKKLTWYSIRSGMLIAMLIAGFSESEIKAISLHSHNSRVLNSNYLDKLSQLQGTAYGRFLAHFHKASVDKPLPKTHHLWNNLRLDIQKFLDELRTDLLTRMRTDNLLERRILGDAPAIITPSYLDKHCHGRCPQVTPINSFAELKKFKRTPRKQPVCSPITPLRKQQTTTKIINPPRPKPQPVSTIPSTQPIHQPLAHPNSPNEHSDDYDSDDSSEPRHIPKNQPIRHTPSRKCAKPIIQPVWPLADFPWKEIKKVTTINSEEITPLRIQLVEDLTHFDWDPAIPAAIRQEKLRKLAKSYTQRLGSLTRGHFVDAWTNVYDNTTIPDLIDKL